MYNNSSSEHRQSYLTGLLKKENICPVEKETRKQRLRLFN